MLSIVDYGVDEKIKSETYQIVNVSFSRMWRKIRLQVSKIRQEGTFIRYVSIVTSWNIAISLVQFALSPIITRLYSPEQYGVFAVFNTIVTNLVLIGSLRYNEAIVVTETPEQRNNAIALSSLSILGVSLLASAAVFWGSDYILQFIGVSWPDYLLYLIPVATLLGGGLEILISTNVSRKRFISNGLSGFFLNLLSRGFNIFYAFNIQARAIGLVWGDITGKIAGITVALFSFGNLKSKTRKFYETVSWSGVKRVAHLYKNFPFYTLPTNLLLLLSGHLPIYFFQIHFTSQAVGNYALSSSLLEIVNRLIPYSIAGVFLPKAMELKKMSLQHLSESTYKLYWAMFWMALLIFSGFAMLGKIVFPFVFGESWQTAGIYVAILSLQYAINFIAISLSDVYKVLSKQRFYLNAIIFSVVLKFGILFLSAWLGLSEKYALLWFCLAGCAGSMVQIVGIFKTFNFRIFKISFSLLLLIAALTIIIFVVNF